MALLWNSIWILLILYQSVYSENIDSNASKLSERQESSGSGSGTQSGYESNIFPSHPSSSQSSPALNNNGYNDHKNSLSLSESSSAHIYGTTEHQTNDKKERKTLILAIPMKLSLPGQNQDNYDTSVSKPIAETARTQSQTLFYNPYLSGYSQPNRHSLQDSMNSEDSEQSFSKPPQLPPLSHKIYSSLDSQSKSASYSTANSSPLRAVNEQPIQSILGYNEHKYTNSDQFKDHRLGQQIKDDNNYRLNTNEEYKGIPNEGIESNYGSHGSYGSYGSDKYSKSEQQIKYDDTYDAKVKLKERSKLLYDSMSDSKPEYDYDSSSGTEPEDDDNIKADDSYGFPNTKDFNNKNRQYLRNSRKNQHNVKTYANFNPNQDMNSQYYYNRESGHSLPVLSTEPSLDGWPQYFYKSNLNTWPQIPESFDANLLNLLNEYRNKNQESVKNGLYGQAFDLLADGQLKAASNVVPFKTLQNSKIYNTASNQQPHYQPINLFAGYGRDYSLVDMNGELYPAPLVASTPSRKQHKPSKHNNEFAVKANRDSIKPALKNPLLLRPSFISGLRSAATKPMTNYTPFMSASTNSFFSALPALPTTAINKSIPRQIFPLFYG